MKKASIIVLLSIYTLSIFGISIKEFYCCGNLKTVTLSVASQEKDQGEMANTKSGCCETKYHFFKIKDSHLVKGASTLPAKTFTDFIPFIFIEPKTKIINGQPLAINGSHAPPILSRVPIYISNCVFRI